MQKVENRRKINNRGFSLVELIIVIGIMGILLVILVPQYTRYLENSRVAKDDTQAASVVSVLEVMINDQTFSRYLDASTVITIGSAGVVVTTPSTGSVHDAIQAGLIELLGLSTASDLAAFAPVSNTYNGKSYTINIDENTGAGDIKYLVVTTPANWA